jgi:hypothetical protein
MSLRLNCQQVRLSRGWTHDNPERSPDAPVAANRALHTESFYRFNAAGTTEAPGLPCGIVVRFEGAWKWQKTKRKRYRDLISGREWSLAAS